MLLDLLFPIRCAGCGQVGEYLCPKCTSSLKPLSTIHDPKSSLDGTVSLFKYNHPLPKLLHQLKYNFVTDCTPSLSKLASDRLISDYPHLLEYWRTNSFVFTPIPLHWSRQNWRGFNQSALLVQSISHSLGLKYCQILNRPHYSPTQVSLPSRQSRLSNQDNSFALLPDLSSIPPNIIIFDDVITTGATINHAASVLKPYTSSLWALSLAG